MFETFFPFRMEDSQIFKDDDWWFGTGVFFPPGKSVVFKRFVGKKVLGIRRGSVKLLGLLAAKSHRGFGRWGLFFGDVFFEFFEVNVHPNTRPI